MLEIINQSITLAIVINILAIIFIWLFIRSAVRSGTKQAIMECYRSIIQIENKPEMKEKYLKTAEEEAWEEYNNW